MKKLLFILVLSFFVSCSSDDDNPQANNCNCRKIIVEYNEATQIWDPVSTSFYSNNCDDDMDEVGEDNNGVYYIIECIPN